MDDSIAFNNAGVNSTSASFLDTTDDEYDRVLGTNLCGVWNCMKAELSHMVKQGSGAVVNCSSIGGIVGSPGRSAYSASKHAIIGLTKSAAIEYAAQGIRINAICPGIFKTPMSAQAPIGRFGEPEEIAGAVLWLCGPASTYMVGHALVADGGFLCR
jgi:NAD(P)-dependent dehydrogenase (short-subunit alcohol dehydrogenase family)